MTKQQRRALFALAVLEEICERTGHVGACGLLNSRYHPAICIRGHWFDVDVPSVPNPFHRLFGRILRWAYPEETHA